MWKTKIDIRELIEELEHLERAKCLLEEVFAFVPSSCIPFELNSKLQDFFDKECDGGVVTED